MMQAETTRSGYARKAKIEQSHEVMNRISHYMMVYGMDLAVSQGLEIEQLLSPDQHVITDLEILMGVQTPALQIIAPFLMQTKHLAQAMLLANFIPEKAISFYANEPREDYSKGERIQTSLEIIEDCVGYLTREHARLYEMAIDFAGEDPINQEILSKNPNSFLNSQFIGNLDINTNLTIAFANATYRTIKELRALLESHPDYPFTKKSGNHVG